MCSWLLGRHHPFVIGEYGVVENVFPQSCGCPLWVDLGIFLQPAKAWGRDEGYHCSMETLTGWTEGKSVIQC